MRIELPADGRVTTEEETLFVREGFAVRFVEISDETRPRLEREVCSRQNEAFRPERRGEPSDEACNHLGGSER
jgi:hypothetical protein